MTFPQRRLAISCGSRTFKNFPAILLSAFDDDDLLLRGARSKTHTKNFIMAPAACDHSDNAVAEGDKRRSNEGRHWGATSVVIFGR